MVLAGFGSESGDGCAASTVQLLNWNYWLQGKAKQLLTPRFFLRLV